MTYRILLDLYNTQSLEYLNEHRNAPGISPISRLPPELLTIIFLLLKTDAEHEKSNSIDWVRVSYVCAHWRRIALECPAFWSYVTYTHYMGTQVVGTLQTDVVDCNCNASSMPFLLHGGPEGQIRSVLGNMWRVRELSLSQDPDYPMILHHLLVDLKAPVPLLEKFCVTFYVFDRYQVS